MNASAVAAFAPAGRTVADIVPARIALLGTGTVGSAVLARLAGWSDTPLGERLSLVHVANSRLKLDPSPTGRGWRASTERRTSSAAGMCLAERCGDTVFRTLTTIPLARGEGLNIATAALGDGGTRILIDATASDAVAAHHAAWLAQGIHVVTACKLGQGTSLARWHAIQAACAHAGTQYGDSATVGAGLPLLRSLRELQAGGDRIHAIAGVLSGSLAWLFNHYDGLRPFSGFVREARDAGYTEPDPRDDLSGEDVRRKTLILARAIGLGLEAADVTVDSLVPPELATRSFAQTDAALLLLDPPLRARYAQAWKNRETLRFVARLDASHDGVGRARVGLESLPADDPLAGGAGSDNRVAIWSDRYRQQPLVIQGPGAGAAVTAAALLDDVLRIAGRGV